MPSIDGEAAAGYSGGSMSGGSVAPVVEAGELCEVLRRAHGVEEILMLDCRGADDYRAGHIRGAVSVGLSSLMLRRLASGKLSLPQVVRHLAADGGDRLARLHQCVPIVLYDHAHASNPLTPTLMTILCRKFNQEGCIAHCLSGKDPVGCVFESRWHAIRSATASVIPISCSAALRRGHGTLVLASGTARPHSSQDCHYRPTDPLTTPFPTR